MDQLAKHPILDLSSALDLRVINSSPKLTKKKLKNYSVNFQNGYFGGSQEKFSVFRYLTRFGIVAPLAVMVPQIELHLSCSEQFLTCHFLLLLHITYCSCWCCSTAWGSTLLFLQSSTCKYMTHFFQKAWLEHRRSVRGFPVHSHHMLCHQILYTVHNYSVTWMSSEFSKVKYYFPYLSILTTESVSRAQKYLLKAFGFKAQYTKIKSILNLKTLSGFIKYKDSETKFLREKKLNMDFVLMSYSLSSLCSFSGYEYVPDRTFLFQNSKEILYMDSTV